jgi:hypothetical protein
MQVENRNHLIPAYAKIESESNIKYMAVDAGLALGEMEDAANHINIVILDASRNNPRASAQKSQNRRCREDQPAPDTVGVLFADG